MMESATYNIKEAMQAILELFFGENTSSINRFIQKILQNNDISKMHATLAFSDLVNSDFGLSGQ